MKLLIDIPKEFEQHFQADRFEDSLHRLSADAHLIAGLYEQETAKMLRDAFKNAIPVPPHGRLIDADALENLEVIPSDNWVFRAIEKAPTIIPACEEVYDKYTDTAGNLHWTGTHSGKHIVKAEGGE